MGCCLSKKQQTETSIQQKYKVHQIKKEAIEMKHMNVLHLSMFLTYQLPYKEVQYSQIKDIKHSAFDQISKDIDRSYPNQLHYTKQQNRIQFQRLLRRIALYLPKLGYTQGINFISGYFLLHGMNQNLAFQAMIMLMIHPAFMHIGFYQDQFPLARIYCMIFWKEMNKIMPDLTNKIQAIDLPDQMWIFQWFICQFLYNFPLEYAPQFFNFILKQKKFGCIKLSIGIMKVLQPKLMAIQPQSFYDEFVQSLNNLKDITYCRQNIPLTKIFLQTQKIAKQSMKNSLNEIYIEDNWYLQYLKSSQNEKKFKYQKYINNKKKQYEEYIKLIKSGSSIQCLRRRQSVRIIDEIQEKKNKKIAATMFNKNIQKNTRSSDNMRFSLQLYSKDNFVQSVYYK